MKYQVRITENGNQRTLPAKLTMEDAKWEIKMQKWLDEMVGDTSRKYNIIEAWNETGRQPAAIIQ